MNLKTLALASVCRVPMFEASFGLPWQEDRRAVCEAAAIITMDKVKLAAKGAKLQELIDQAEALRQLDNGLAKAEAGETIH